jgi:hypothetical protein
MASNGINYRETYFEFPELTKIHGEPTSESLFKLRNELKANAQSVYSHLSDGTHGHLALVLSDAQYAILTNQPFTRPAHPGPLVIPAGTTAVMATAMKDAHVEQIRLFREVQGVEKALIQQIVQAVEAPYLIALRERSSNSLRGTVTDILEHLHTVYGRVSPQMLEDRDQELRNMTYNTKYPIDIVFNAVEDFVDFAELGHQPLTARQTIAKAYIILNKTRRFKTDITDWNRKPEVDKTWTNFKTHFRRAHQEFRETTDLTVEDSELQRNNANLVQQVVDGLQQAMIDEPPTEESSDLLLQMANSVTTQQQLTQQIQQMQQAMALLSSQVATQQQPPQFPQYQPQFQQHQPPLPSYPPNNPFAPRGGRGRSSFGHQGRSSFGTNGRGARGDGGRSRQRNTSIYCWTHGACGHTSAACLAKLPGHQDAATFANKLAGNTLRCPST